MVALRALPLVEVCFACSVHTSLAWRSFHSLGALGALGVLGVLGVGVLLFVCFVWSYPLNSSKVHSTDERTFRVINNASKKEHRQ